MTKPGGNKASRPSARRRGSRARPNNQADSKANSVNRVYKNTVSSGLTVKDGIFILSMKTRAVIKVVRSIGSTEHPAYSLLSEARYEEEEGS